MLCCPLLRRLERHDLWRVMPSVLDGALLLLGASVASKLAVTALALRLQSAPEDEILFQSSEDWSRESGLLCGPRAGLRTPALGGSHSPSYTHRLEANVAKKTTGTAAKKARKA